MYFNMAKNFNARKTSFLFRNFYGVRGNASFFVHRVV